MTNERYQCIAISGVLITFFAALMPSFSINAKAASEQLLQQSASHIGNLKSQQVTITQLDSSIQSVREDARSVEHDIRLQQRYQYELEKQISDLSIAYRSLDDELDNIRNTKLNLRPLMENMAVTLKRLVEFDLPFRRATRIANIEQLMKQLSDPAINDTQKLEHIFLAYQAEQELSYQVETWQGRLSKDQQVTFLRIGRLSYYYVNLEGNNGSRWLKDSGWVPMSPKELTLVTSAIAQLNNRAENSILFVPREEVSS